jgi:hypothetical protein
MGRRPRTRKDLDDESIFLCAGSSGILREEVWVDDDGNVVRYNLALILPHLFSKDNGRVLGYDNAHGFHERHFMGEVQVASFNTYRATARRFYREAEALRKRYEDKSL